jgi:hypothetical protein
MHFALELWKRFLSAMILCAAFRLSRAVSVVASSVRRGSQVLRTRYGTTGQYEGECVFCLSRVSANGRFSFAEQTVTCAEYFDKMEM